MKKILLGILFLGVISTVDAKAAANCYGTYNNITVTGSEDLMFVTFHDSGKLNGKKIKLKRTGMDGDKIFYIDNPHYNPKARAYVSPSVYSRGVGEMSVHLKHKGGKNDYWRRYSYSCK